MRSASEAETWEGVYGAPSAGQASYRGVSVGFRVSTWEEQLLQAPLHLSPPQRGKDAAQGYRESGIWEQS